MQQKSECFELETAELKPTLASFQVDKSSVIVQILRSTFGSWSVRMMRFLQSVFVLSLCGFMLTGCTEEYSWHQKLTLEIETPEGLKTASSVVAVTWRENSSLGKVNGPEFTARLEGEPPFVELRPGVYLFASLRGNEQIALTSFDDDPVQYASARRMAATVEKQRAVREVPGKVYPLLVTFADIADPKTVTRVDPDNIAASFGPDYRLKRITVEITDEPVTQGQLEPLLTWLSWSREKLLAAGNGRSPLQVKIGTGYLALDDSSFRRLGQ